MKNSIVILPSEKIMQEKLLSIWNDFDLHIFADNISLKPIDDNYIVIGDMDSFNKTTHNVPTDKILHIPDQNTTDSEKAILYSIKLNMQNICLFGNPNSRSDHFLYNLGLLYKYYKNFQSIYILNQYEKISIIDKPTIIQGKINQKIAFFSPFQETFNVSITGLKYNMKSQNLRLGTLSSSSNHFAHNNVSVSFDDGGTLIYIISSLDE